MYNRIKNRLFASLFQIYLFFCRSPLVDKNSPAIVVSLTSYEARYNVVYWAIKSIMVQTLKPRHIVLYLDKNVCEKDLPRRLLGLKKYGLEIKCICEDIKPHKKYFYAMQDFFGHAVITIDDDVMYEPQTIESLYKSYKKFPNAVSAKRICRMTKNKFGALDGYNSWIGEYTGLLKPSHSFFATGVGGVLYPPACFDLKWFNVKNIQDQCLNADDVWLKYLEIMHHRKVVYAPGKMVHPYSCRVKSGLQDSNVNLSKNDVYIDNLRTFFGVNLEEFIED